MGSSVDGDADCPICCNELDLTDRSIQYCNCGFQPCLWCYHHILEEAAKESLPARCPNCRSQYDQNKISMQHIDAEQLEEEKRKLKERERPKGQCGAGGGSAASAASRFLNRANLANVRVVQPNLVYAVGLPMEICDEDILKTSEFFGQFGKMVKVSVNRSNQYASALAKHGPTGSAYVTFRRSEDALRCIKSTDGALWRGKPVKACFGTTKYCNAFLKGVPCNNPDCLYLHDLADEGDCLTKEEVAAGLLPARFLAMGASNTFRPRLTINAIPNVVTAAAQAAAAAAAAAGQPRSAIEAAAAAAGGVSRMPSQGGNSRDGGLHMGPRILTIPAPTVRTGSLSSLPGQDGMGSAGSSAPSGSPGRGLLAAAVQQQGPGGASISRGGQWASLASSGSHGTGSVVPPPPSDKQEWPTLAGPGGMQSYTASAAGPPEDAAELHFEGPLNAANNFNASTFDRAPSMAEQLARAHSNPPSEAKLRQKKLVPLASPGKLKPLLGKTPSGIIRPASPLDAHAAGNGSTSTKTDSSRIMDADITNGTGIGMVDPHPGSFVGGAATLDLSQVSLNSKDDSAKAAGTMNLRPPPGFGSGFAATTMAAQPPQQQLSSRRVAPPPGFGMAQPFATTSTHSSTDTAPQGHADKNSNGNSVSSAYSAFDGLGGTGNSLFGDASAAYPGSSGGFSGAGLPLGSGSGSGGALPAINVQSSLGGPPALIPGLSRRQKSRFAFAQNDDNEMSPRHPTTSPQQQQQGFSNYTTGGISLHTRLASPSSAPVQPAPSTESGPSAFFKSLFPSANITVLSQNNNATTNTVSAGGGAVNGVVHGGPHSNLVGPLHQPPLDFAGNGAAAAQQHLHHNHHQQQHQQQALLAPGLELLRQLHGET